MIPKVSIICPTYNRPEYHFQLYSMFIHQTHTNKELLILDDSPHPSPFFSQLTDDRVTYIHVSIKVSIGEKRNLLINLAQGEIIAHFDDDDFYASDYIHTMVQLLQEADLIKLSCWVSWQKINNKFWEWDAALVQPYLYEVKGTGEITKINITDYSTASLPEKFVWGYGFSYVYKKSLAEEIPFEDRDHGEDYLFVEKAIQSEKNCIYIADHPHLVLHTLHEKSTSGIYAQKQLTLPQILEIYEENISAWLNNDQN